MQQRNLFFYIAGWSEMEIFMLMVFIHATQFILQTEGLCFNCCFRFRCRCFDMIQAGECRCWSSRKTSWAKIVCKLPESNNKRLNGTNQFFIYFLLQNSFLPFGAGSKLTTSFYSSTELVSFLLVEFHLNTFGWQFSGSSPCHSDDPIGISIPRKNIFRFIGYLCVCGKKLFPSIDFKLENYFHCFYYQAFEARQEIAWSYSLRRWLQNF